jgi:hypothetical protein
MKKTPKSRMTLEMIEYMISEQTLLPEFVVGKISDMTPPPHFCLFIEINVTICSRICSRVRGKLNRN